MCRWLAYSGDPIALSDLVFDTRHSLIDQSIAAHFSGQTTNGDGFGIGWYDELPNPGMYKHTQPAWNDANLRDLCEHTRSRMFLAHVRASTGTAIQQSNCHPFRHGRWLFVHNGVIRDYLRLRRELSLALGEELYVELKGTTDSELMFYLALQFGMEGDVLGGVARMVGFVEDVGYGAGVEHPMQMTLGIADGERLYAFRYSSEGQSRTLFHSTDIEAIREELEPEHREHLESIHAGARVIVSEPLSDLPQLWQEIPESSFVTIEGGHVEHRDFIPIRP
jgi:glutamine amidotransferase